MESNNIPGEISWKRPLTALEVFYSIGQSHGTVIVCYASTLRTLQPITKELYVTALKYLYKKVPTLKLRIRRHEDGRLWFYETSQEIINYQFLTKGKTEDIMKDLSHEPFEETISLWRSFCLALENPRSNLDIGDEFLHESQFIIGIHHAISDGLSNLKICETFFLIVDALMNGETVDLEPVGVFLDTKTPTDFLNENRRELLLASEDLESKLEATKEVFFNKISYWTKCFPQYETSLEKTEHVEDLLNEDETKKLLLCFKNHKVTANAGINAIMNAYIVCLLQKNGLKLPNYDIGVMHGVDLKRYWKVIDPFVYGLNIGIMRIYVDTSGEVADHFWVYAKDLSDIIKWKLDNQIPIEEDILGSIILKDSKENDLHYIFEGKIPLNLYYSISNLGNIDNFVEHNGKNVLWSELTRTISMHGMSNPLNLNCHTFRGKFCFSFEYNTRYISENLSQKLIAEFKAILKELPLVNSFKEISIFKAN